MTRAIALLAFLCGGCNAIFGVDALTYEGVGGAVATGGSAGDDQSGGFGGAPPSVGGGGMGGGGGAPALWWDDAFMRRARIDVDVDALGGDVIDVPLFVRLDDGVIDTGSVAANGDDLRFLDATQQVVFDHELVAWVDQIGGNIWVQVSQLDATHDHIWLYYANPAAPAVGGNVFDTFQMVHHFETEIGNVTPDAVGGLDATLVGAATLAPGIVGTGVSLSGGVDEVTMADVPQLEPVAGEVRALSVWMQTTVSGAQPVWIKESQCRGWTFGLTGTNSLRGDLRTSNSNCAAHTDFFTDTSSPVVNDGAWHHVAFIVDRALDRLTLIVDGGLRASGNMGDSALADQGIPRLGRNPFDPNSSFVGSFDELWVSNVQRPEAWFAAVYLNGTGALLTFGSDEGHP